MCTCVRACVRACVRVCVRACVSLCVCSSSIQLPEVPTCNVLQIHFERLENSMYCNNPHAYVRTFMH